MDNSDSELFCLKWNNFQDNLASGFADLLQQEAMVDVTLAVEGKIIQAHKIILSVCSSYFRNMFQVNPCKHPIIVLKDVGYSELTDLLDFMYKGEAKVKQEDLPAFLKLAEVLKIRGLVNSQTEKKEALIKKSPAIKLKQESENLENKEVVIRKKRRRMGCPFKPLESKSASHNEKIVPVEESSVPEKKLRTIVDEFTSFKEEFISDEASQDTDDEVNLNRSKDDEVMEDDLNAGPSGMEETNDTMPQDCWNMRRTSKPLSAIWSFFNFDYVENKSQCKICGKIFKASPKTGTASVKYHLHFAHQILKNDGMGTQ